MKNILIAVEDYPNNDGGVALMYVHTRNKAYSENGLGVTVLNFQAKENYIYDGIRVITKETYLCSDGKYDILVCHAANIKHHYSFLKSNGNKFPRFVFFFHGHEVLKINQTYSKPYPYIRNSVVKSWIQDCYDDFKLDLWRKYFISVKEKSTFVFVSQWMLEEFLKWTKIPYGIIKEHCEITYNCIGEVFEKTTYNPDGLKDYDFLTIRSNLDGSKYCVDLVNNLAVGNPDFKFLLVGKGEFFKHYKKAPNLMWLDQTMNHEEIIYYIQKSSCALMPTRTDAQGLMMCEMASTGMPLITSNLPVCQEVFSEFDNVAFIDNNLAYVDLRKTIEKLKKNLPYRKNEKYYNVKTSRKEIMILNRREE